MNHVLEPCVLLSKLHVKPMYSVQNDTLNFKNFKSFYVLIYLGRKMLKIHRIEIVG